MQFSAEKMKRTGFSNQIFVIFCFREASPDTGATFAGSDSLLCCQRKGLFQVGGKNRSVRRDRRAESGKKQVASNGPNVSWS
jgi:hypothetical protein